VRSTATLPVTLSSNGREIPFDDAHFTPMRDSSGLLDDPAALRDRLKADGYLLLRGVLDRDEVLDVRRAYFGALGDGYLVPGSDPMDGLFSGAVPEDLSPYGVPGHPAHAFVRSERFAAFCSAPPLTALASALLGGPADLLPRQIMRHFWSGTRRASRAHTDYDYMALGTDQVVTTWIPVGDCPLETGGLIYLDRSWELGQDELSRLRTVTDRADDRRPISHDLAWTVRETGRRWLWADYHTGDLTVHSPHIVHASLDTMTTAMRLSVDLRFQRRGDLVDRRWSSPWSADDGA
jgi:ectoine hydroxylase-related dioxygenase (phytanoyl-CoA dioxygenase family)